MMNIVVNAEPRHVTATTLKGALRELEFSGQMVTTAVKGLFIARELRASTKTARW